MRLIVEGNATRAPEIRAYDSEDGKVDLVAYFTLAVNYNVIGGDERHTEYFTVKVKGWRAESVCENIDKGTRVVVEGTQVFRNNEKFKTVEPMILASYIGIVSPGRNVSRETPAEEAPF